MGLMALSGSRADLPYLRHFDPIEMRAHSIDGAAFCARVLLEEHEPSLLLVLGDRWEIATACLVATHMGVPIAHLGAGETTLGSYDEQFRGAIEALASIRFAMTHEAYHKAASGTQHLVGCTSVEPGPILPGDGTAIIIFHPETRGHLDGRVRDTAVDAVTAAGLSPIVLGANPDRGSEAFPGADHLDDFHERLRSASVIIGNSSAGIIEAPILGTPTVNIGIRQQGRPRSASVFDCGPEGIEQSLAEALKFGKQRVESPYWRHGSVEKIKEVCNDYMRRR